MNAIDLTEPEPRPSAFAPLAYGFRPFFLLAALYAAFAIPVYLTWLEGFGHEPQRVPVVVWHGHEMLFGFAGAALGGFLLTAVPAWTGAGAVAGPRLGVLVVLWLLGRVAMGLLDALPWQVVAAADIVFLPAVACAVAPALIKANNRRNYAFFVVVAAMTLANALVHLEAGGVLHEGRRGLFLALDILLLMITLISGRIVPVFTGTFLRVCQPGSSAIAPNPVLDALCIASMAVVAVADLVWGDSEAFVGYACLFTAVMLAVRLARWRTVSTIGTPILFILHAGVIWLVLGLAARGLALAVGLLPSTAALHILTMGAIGTMIMGVMSRAALGHTGREMKASPAMVMAYVLLALAVLTRLAGGLLDGGQAPGLLLGAGILWTAAFGLFAGVIAPIVLLPRVDGQPG
ncbi:MAG TPA: NnrS family protein [Vineibacter sp.]|nr:NnrS family protein [Vineibacter sp.]